MLIFTLYHCHIYHSAYNYQCINYNPPGSKELAIGVSEALKQTNAVIMQNHGAIVVGKSIKDAYYLYELLEYMAQVFVQEKLLKL